MSPQRRMRLLSFLVESSPVTAQVQTFTFPAPGDADASDFAIFYDHSGNSWAFALDVTGSDVEPTATEWDAVDANRKVQVDISGESDAADVAAAVETAINALTGFTTAFTTDDSAGDGTMILTNDTAGVVTDPATYNEDGSDAGTIAVVVDTQGAARSATLTKGKFDATLTSAAAGTYVLTFAEPYERAPEVGALASTDNAICKVSAATNLAVTINTENLSGNALEASFNVIVCGSDTEDFI